MDLRHALALTTLLGVLLPAGPCFGEAFAYLATPVDVTPGTPSSWEDVNVSAWAPAGATGVIVQVVNPTGTSCRVTSRCSSRSKSRFTGRSTKAVTTFKGTRFAAPTASRLARMVPLSQ